MTQQDIIMAKSYNLLITVGEIIDVREGDLNGG
jgi:hypothetical protein